MLLAPPSHYDDQHQQHQMLLMLLMLIPLMMERGGRATLWRYTLPQLARGRRCCFLCRHRRRRRHRRCLCCQTEGAARGAAAERSTTARSRPHRHHSATRCRHPPPLRILHHPPDPPVPPLLRASAPKLSHTSDGRVGALPGVAAAVEIGRRARRVSAHPLSPGWRQRRALARPLSTRVRCVSIFLDKNRRYIGKSQSERPPKRTQRTPHQLRPAVTGRRLPKLPASLSCNALCGTMVRADAVTSVICLRMKSLSPRAGPDAVTRWERARQGTGGQGQANPT
jgi:hypothetical protein